MTSKPKLARTFVVHHRGQMPHGGYTAVARYRVGARNEKDAIKFVKEVAGKHRKLVVSYEVKDRLLPQGMVLEEWRRKQ